MEAAIEELSSMFGHQVAREEMMEVLLANNYDLNSSISALIQKGNRQSPDRRYESRQGKYPFQYLNAEMLLHFRPFKHLDIGCGYHEYDL